MFFLLALGASALAQSPATINHAVETPADPLPQVATGELMFDARLPAEIQVDGQKVAELYMPGRVAVDVPIGAHQVMVLTNGVPRTIAIDVKRVGTAVVMIGRTGLTAAARGTEGADAEGPAPVELRVAGNQDVLVQIGKERWRVNARGTLAIQVPQGEHTMSVRSGNGTVVWATGKLELHGTSPVVLQLAEGRMPEVSGAGSAFHPGS